MASERITADAVEVSEYPDLINKYNIRGVPKIVINDQVEFEGALPEKQFVERVLSAKQQKGEQQG